MATKVSAPDVTAQPEVPMTPQAFLAWELNQEAKHEFADGAVAAFAGGTIEHAAMARTLMLAIGNHLRGTPCRVYGSDILIGTASTMRYADLVVTCDVRDREPRAATLQYPKLIIEVLSPSTASVDRSEKLDEYRTINTLDEYLLVDSRKRWVEVVRRSGSDWLTSLPMTSGALQLVSIDLRLSIDDLYRDAEIV